MNLGPLTKEATARVYLTLNHRVSVNFHTYVIKEGNLIFRGRLGGGSPGREESIFPAGKWLYVIFDYGESGPDGNRQTT